MALEVLCETLRILFSIPDYFHLGVKDFLSFLLGQVLLAIYALTFGVRTSSQPKVLRDENEPQENIKVRTQGLAGCLERIFMRYFSDAEYFHESISEHQKNEPVTRNPFQNFISELAELCRTDFIGRRLTSKIFLHLGSHAASKLAKVAFSCKDIDDDNSVASIVFYPRVEFVEQSSQWKYIIRTLPLKTVTKSKGFWSHWAKYIAEDFSYCVDFWQECVEHWIILNKTSSVDVHRLYSASLAVAAFARNLKLNLKKQEDKDQIDKYSAKLDAGKVLQNIIHSLESVNEDKRACGMALGQVVADLQALSWSSSTTTTTSEKIEPLKFESKSLRFVDIVDFYENGLKEDEESESETVKTTKSNPVEVLDSDDDVEEGNECEDDGFPVMQDEYVTEDPKIAIDRRILTLRARKRKIPMYFSEIVEALLESSKDEDEAEILRCIVVLKIPVLLSMSVNIDVQMAAKITRCLADMEDGTCLEIPVLFALYGLFMKHPFDVADTIGHIVFDRTHYALGQRIMNLTRLTQIVMLSSKQLCYNCFREKLKKHEKELRGIYPEFFCKYFEARIKLWACSSCRKEIKELKEEPSQQAAAASHAESNEILTWRQIIDKRLEAKTRYFVTPKHKTPVILPDEYSNKLLPILWSCIANRLTSTAGYYLDNEGGIRSGNMHDMFMIKIFQYLARCVFGSSGANCNHIANVASHAGELITHFVRYEDAIVRRTVLSLLGVILSMGEGKVFIIEALSSQGNIVEKVDLLLESEQDDENRKFLKYIQRYVAEATTLGLLSDLSQNTGKSPFSVL